MANITFLIGYVTPRRFGDGRHQLPSRGKSIVKGVPVSLLLTQIKPRCASTTDLLIAKPSPVPLAFSCVTNGSKMRGNNCAGIPQPVSPTSKYTRESTRLTV